ncbi:hypothetical protein ACQ4M3_13380 [Leptolyngbya sp. AN03gr2]|uniref:hypothetical protein n=1 Tax=unclassified Leptolyngbya TaxID=2650499 RepID=UPI003D318ED5
MTAQVTTKDADKKFGEVKTLLYTTAPFSRTELPDTPKETILESLFYITRSLSRRIAVRKYNRQHSGKQNYTAFDYDKYDKEVFGAVYGTPDAPKATVEEFTRLGKRLSGRVLYSPSPTYELLLMNEEEQQRMNSQKDMKAIKEMIASIKSSAAPSSAEIEAVSGVVDDIDDLLDPDTLPNDEILEGDDDLEGL